MKQATLHLTAGAPPAPPQGSPINSPQAMIDEAFARGHQAHLAGRLAEAEAIYREILRWAPDHGDCLNLLGCVRGALGDHDGAAVMMRRACEVNPRVPEYFSNLGEAYRGLGRHEDAVACFAAALRLKPDLVEAHNNLGIAYQDLCQLDDAIRHYDEAIRLRSGYLDARWNRALCLLLAGRYQDGFREYEWRWQVKALPRIRPIFQDPPWRGQTLARGRLMLHSEQGMGDTLQFCRFVPQAATRARTLLEVEAPLVRLLQALPGIEGVVARSETPPAFVRHCPLMSLPIALDLDLGDLPGPMPYLTAPATDHARWQARLADTPGLKVGITWRGRAEHRNDRHRSMPTEALATLAPLPGVSLFGIQPGMAPADPAGATAGLRFTLLDQFEDYADTAGLIESLDLVIAVDTSVAHLAGALGKPVWLMVPKACDWRWLLDRADSPWYPSMRIFRQSVQGGWTGLLQTVRAELLAVVAGDRRRLLP